MGIRWSNNASTTLSSAITTGQTSITVANGSVFPTISGSDYFYLTLGSLVLGTEIVRCTARSANVLTVVRAQEGTTAIAFQAGDAVELRVTAAGLVANANPDITTSSNLTPVDADTPVPTYTGPSNIVGAINGASQALLNKLTYALARIFPSYAGNAGKALFVNAGATGVEWKTLPAQAYVPVGSYLPFSRTDTSFTDNGATWLKSGVTTLASVYPTAPSRTLYSGSALTTHTAPAGSNVVSVAVNGNVVILASPNSSTGYRSTDGGLTFSTITFPTSVGSSPAIGYVNGTSLWLVASLGSQYFNCYESTDNGTSWTDRTNASSVGFVPTLPNYSRIYSIGNYGYIFGNDTRVWRIQNGTSGPAQLYTSGPTNPIVTWYDGTYYCALSSESVGSGYSINIGRTKDFTAFQYIRVPSVTAVSGTGRVANGTQLGMVINNGSGTMSFIDADGNITQLQSTGSAPTNAVNIGTEFFYNVSSKLWVALDPTKAPTNPTASTFGAFFTAWTTPAAGICFHGSSIYRTLPTESYVDNLSANFADSPVNSKPFYMRVA